MNIKKIDPYHLGLVVLLIAFVTFKWRFLGLPLYWDEAWVYGPAVRTMYANGLSLLPNSIGTDLSRGHPLLFHFLAALWARCFGPSNTSLHVFALFLSVLMLVLVYRIGTRLGSRQIGIAAILILGLNEVFLAQSGILLPEIALGLFFLWAVWAYMSKNAIGYVVAATCALFTKESAIVLILAILCWHFISAIANRRLRTAMPWVVILILPLLPAFLFLLYQRVQYGWFFFPEHLRLISWDIKDIHYLFKFGYRELFEQQGMEWATIAFGVIAPMIWKGWSKRYMGVVVAFIYVAAIKILDGKWALPPLSTLLVTFTCFGLILLLQFVPLYRKEGARGEFSAVALILVFGFLLFSSINFFSDRYLVGMMSFVALGMSAVLYSALNPWHKLLFPAVVLVLAARLLTLIGQDGRVGDTRLSYADDIHVQQKLIRTCEGLHLQDACIYGSFMEKAYMTDASLDYLDGTVAFRNISDTITASTEYALVSQSSPKEVRDQIDKAGFVLIDRFESGPAWGELYKSPLHKELNATN